MKESDFILATNLARVRLAMQTVAQLYGVNAGDEKVRDNVLRELRGLEERWDEQLEKRKGKKET